jgi:pilus assembly protein Flp/PilA
MFKFLIPCQKGVRRLRRDDRGATAIEYGLIAGAISLALVAAIFLFGDSLSGLYDTIALKMVEANEEINN